MMRGFMKAGECKHFCGIQKTLCNAGVNLRHLVGGEDFGWAGRIPCIKSSLSKDVVPCGKFEPLTEAEYEAKMANFRVRLADMMVARERITSQPGFMRGSSGSIECPTCRAAIAWSCASNGHIHARCATKGCLAWME